MADPLGTAICVPTFPTLPAAGGTFVDPCFGTSIVRVTDAADCATADGSISTIRALSRDPAQPYFILTLRGGAAGPGGQWLYRVNASTLAITKVRQLTATNNIYPPTAIWDWSGAHDTRIIGLVQDNTDAFRGFRWYDVIADTGGDLVTQAEALTALRITGTVVSASSSSVFVGNQTDPESADGLYNGMTVTFTSGALSGQTQTIATSTLGKTFTMASGFTGTPVAGAAYRINYLGYQGNPQISLNGRYLSWWVSEGHSSRGIGQDTARTLLYYDTQTSTMTRHIFTTAEATTGPTTLGGIHNIQLSPDGTTVMITGFVSNQTWFWTPTTDTMAGPYGEILHHEVTDNRWVQEGYGGVNSLSRTWIYRLYSAPAPTPSGNNHVFFTWPTKAGLGIDNLVDSYLTMNHLDQTYTYAMMRHDLPISGWTLDSGAVYKVTWPPANCLPLISANDPWVRFNGAGLTLAASRVAMSAGTFFDDNVGLLYVWGPLSEKLDADADKPVVVNTGTSTTVFALTSALAAQTDGYYVGRLLDFDSSSTNAGNSYAQARITAYTASTRQVTVTPSLPVTPTATGTGTIRANRVEAMDWRPYLNEIVKLPLDASTPRRVVHTGGWPNATGLSFDQNGVVNSSSDGALVLWLSQWNGGLRRDAFIAKAAEAFSGRSNAVAGAVAGSL